MLIGCLVMIALAGWDAYRDGRHWRKLAIKRYRR